MKVTGRLAESPRVAHTAYWLRISAKASIEMCLGIPGQIVEITDPRRKLALVDVSGVKREICIACVCAPDQEPAALLDEWVLVHVGFAMAKISATEAQQSLQLLVEMGEMIESDD